MASKDIIKYQWEIRQSGNKKARPRKFVSTLVDYGYSNIFNVHKTNEK